MTKVKTIAMSFLGTSEHRETDSHIITSFHQALVRENSNNSTFTARLFDGLGSIPKQLDSTNPMPGTYIYDPNQQRKVLIEPAISQSVTQAIQMLSGVTVGGGMEDLLFEAMLYLNEIIIENEGELPETINLQGFSRGADACMRLANIIYQFYPNIKVNLFLIDQVPGPGRRDDVHSYTIPPNVERFEPTLMLHEYRPGFEPQHAGTYVYAAPDKTKVAVKLYYGDHGGSNIISENAEVNHAPILLYDDLYRFCLETGSLPNGGQGPSYIANRDPSEKDMGTLSLLPAMKRFELLCGMKKNEALYAKGFRFIEREILFKREDYVRDSTLFINQEHRELFKKLCPKSFHWFFEKNYTRTATREEVVAELKILADDPRYDDFLFSLAEYFGFDITKIEESLPRPSGLHQEEKSQLAQPLVRDRISYLRHALCSIVNYYNYHCVSKSLTSELCKKFINKFVNLSYTFEDTKAIRYLEKMIDLTKGHLGLLKEKGFLWQQLSTVAPNIMDYTKQIFLVLNEHLSHNTLLSKAQRDEITKTIGSIKLIIDDNHKDFYQKYHEIRYEIIALNERIIRLESDDEFVYDMFNSAYHLIQNDKQKIYNLATLSQSLNYLSNAHFGETDLCDSMIQALKGYQNRNLFWNSVKSILNHCGISFPQVYSKSKERIAVSLQQELEQLKEEGQGNDIDAIRKTIDKAQANLFNYYRENVKVQRGALDKIINSSLKLCNEKRLTDTSTTSESPDPDDLSEINTLGI